MDSVLERIMDKNFNSELEEWFPEVESLTKHRSIVQLLVTIEERVNCRETSVSQITRPWVQVVIVIIFYHPSGNILFIRTISLGLPCLKQTAPDKHVIAKMPMVTFVVTSLTRLTAIQSVWKRDSIQVQATGGFSLPRRFAIRFRTSRRSFLLTRKKFSRKPSKTNILGPG